MCCSQSLAVSNEEIFQASINIEDIKAYLFKAEGSNMLHSMVRDGYRFRSARTQNDLREKAQIFDCNLDDRVIEFLKVIFIAQLHEKHPDVKVANAFFHNEPHHSILIYADNNNTYGIEIDENLYDRINKSERLRFDEEPRDILCIDQQWALRFFQNR